MYVVRCTYIYLGMYVCVGGLVLYIQKDDRGTHKLLGCSLEIVIYYLSLSLCISWSSNIESAFQRRRSQGLLSDCDASCRLTFQFRARATPRQTVDGHVDRFHGIQSSGMSIDWYCTLQKILEPISRFSFLSLLSGCQIVIQTETADRH